MNKSAILRARIDPQIKEDAEQILTELGLTISEAINIFFRQISRKKGLPFAVSLRNEALVPDSDQAWFWSKAWLSKEQEADNDIKEGRVTEVTAITALKKQLRKNS